MDLVDVAATFALGGVVVAILWLVGFDGTEGKVVGWTGGGLQPPLKLNTVPAVKWATMLTIDEKIFITNSIRRCNQATTLSI